MDKLKELQLKKGKLKKDLGVKSDEPGALIKEMNKNNTYKNNVPPKHTKKGVAVRGLI